MTDNALNDSGLPEDITRGQYTLLAFFAIGITIVVGVIFYIVGATSRCELVTDPVLDQPARDRTQNELTATVSVDSPDSEE